MIEEFQSILGMGIHMCPNACQSLLWSPSLNTDIRYGHELVIVHLLYRKKNTRKKEPGNLVDILYYLMIVWRSIQTLRIGDCQNRMTLTEITNHSQNHGSKRQKLQLENKESNHSDFLLNKLKPLI